MFKRFSLPKWSQRRRDAAAAAPLRAGETPSHDADAEIGTATDGLTSSSFDDTLTTAAASPAAPPARGAAAAPTTAAAAESASADEEDGEDPEEAEAWQQASDDGASVQSPPPLPAAGAATAAATRDPAPSKPPPPPPPSHRPGATITQLAQEGALFTLASNGCKVRRDIRWADKPPALEAVARRGGGTSAELAGFSIFRTDDPLKAEIVAAVFREDDGDGAKEGAAAAVDAPTPHGPVYKTLLEDRLFGCMMGLVCGDALGAPMEFKPVRYSWEGDAEQVHDLSYHKTVGADGKRGLRSRFGLKGGQWTDDTSMALCFADSLISKGRFDALDCKLRYALWWETGYNNAFGRDRGRAVRSSVGLGESIGRALDEYAKEGWAYTRRGTRRCSGNGSLMRNAPVPLFFHADERLALLASQLQSFTTHRGDEAAELCKLLTFICLRAAHHPSDDPHRVREEVLGEQGLQEFPAEEKGVRHLVRAQKETPTQGQPWCLADRDWSWRKPEYRFSPSRAAAQPGYVGSYAMDAVAMALHLVWTSRSLEEALLRAANQCGDADSVGAVTGQIAGAIYGLRHVPRTWLRAVQKWDNDGEILLRCHKLVHREAPTDPAVQNWGDASRC